MLEEHHYIKENVQETDQGLQQRMYIMDIVESQLLVIYTMQNRI
jgi:hypothetical protein